MSTSDGQHEEPSAPSRKQAAVILGTIGDTTWRMFVPTIGFMLLGMWIDTKLHTAPWCMLAGLLLGIALSTVLIHRQINEVNN